MPICGVPLLILLKNRCWFSSPVIEGADIILLHRLPPLSMPTSQRLRHPLASSFSSPADISSPRHLATPLLLVTCRHLFSSSPAGLTGGSSETRGECPALEIVSAAGWIRRSSRRMTSAVGRAPGAGAVSTAVWIRRLNRRMTRVGSETADQACPGLWAGSGA